MVGCILGTDTRVGVKVGFSNKNLMPRVRNWKDLTFYRPTAEVRYRYIDALFGEPGRNVIDWQLIEAHYADVMRVVLSVQEGKISSATLLRRLSTYSRRNNIYQAFREIGLGFPSQRGEILTKKIPPRPCSCTAVTSSS